MAKVETMSLMCCRAAPPDANPREVWRWSDVQAVEMCSREYRTYDLEDDEKLDQASVKLAERMIKVGK